VFTQRGEDLLDIARCHGIEQPLVAPDAVLRVPACASRRRLAAIYSAE
jgi:hypothetical protein